MGGLKEKFTSTGRGISKSITDGAESVHIGSHTPETTSQELYSLRNTKPAFRGSKWKKRAEGIRKSIMSEISKNQPRYQYYLIELNQIEEMR
ncbi:hypothetical protein ES702_02814 [subsurface metagenome]